jgi:hypothetical protein
MNRGGARHDKHMLYALEAFTPEQLREMIADPDIVLIHGGEELTEANVAAIEAKPAAKTKG